MKNGHIRKVSARLLALVILSAACYAKASADETYLPPSLVKSELTTLQKYQKELQAYAEDCESQDTSRLSGEKLKQCLTTLRDLRLKFDACLQTYDSIIGKIKSANKWTPELDSDFEKRAPASLVGEVRQKGGFRQAFQSRARDLAADKKAIDDEIRGLEDQFKKSASISSQPFQHVSYKPLNIFNAVAKVVNKIKKAVDELCVELNCAAYG